MYRVIAVVIGLVLSVAATTGLAQFPRATPPPNARIVSGNDIGFRVEGADPRTGAPTGTWMLRVKGEWVEIGAMPSIRPAK